MIPNKLTIPKLLHPEHNITKHLLAGTYRSTDKMCALSEYQGIMLLTLMLSILEEIGIPGIQPVSDLSVQTGYIQIGVFEAKIGLEIQFFGRPIG